MKVLEIRVPCTLRKYNGTGTAAAENGVARTVVFKLIQLKYQPTFFVIRNGALFPLSGRYDTVQHKRNNYSEG